MKSSISILCIFFFCMTLLQLSCSPPKALEYRNFKNFSINKLGVGSSTVSMDLIYFNPNNFGLQLSRVDLDVYINDNFMGHTNQVSRISIPRNEEFSLPISMDIDMKNLWKNALASAISNELTIKIAGTIRVGKGNLFTSFPVKYEGKQQFSIFQ